MRRTACISAGRNTPSPMSLMCSLKVLRALAGSKLPEAWSACSIRCSACWTAPASMSALGVGATPPATRTNSASPSKRRRRVTPWLVAGCDRPSASAARLTLRCWYTASKMRSRLRSSSRSVAAVGDAVCMPRIILRSLIRWMNSACVPKVGRNIGRTGPRRHKRQRDGSPSARSERCARAPARPSMARASWPSPRRCCNRAWPTSAATRVRRCRTCST